MDVAISILKGKKNLQDYIKIKFFYTLSYITAKKLLMIPEKYPSVQTERDKERQQRPPEARPERGRPSLLPWAEPQEEGEGGA